MTSGMYEIKAVERIDNKQKYVPIDLSRGINCSWSLVQIHNMLQGTTNPSGIPIAEFRDISTQELIARLHNRYNAEGAPERRDEIIYGEPFGAEGNKLFREKESSQPRRLRTCMLDALASGELNAKAGKGAN